MSRNLSRDESRPQVVSQVLKAGPWAGCGLVPWFIRIPSWALIPCVMCALACVTLCAIFPQESADRRALLEHVLPRLALGRSSHRKLKSRPSVEGQDKDPEH